VLTRHSIRFAAAVLVALASSLASPNPARAGAPLRHDQVPGFYRLKVGDLEVTSLYDGAAVFQVDWLNDEKGVRERVESALRENPHVLDAGDTAFLVNTGRQLVLVDTGAGKWFGGGALGYLLDSMRSAGYVPEQVDRVLITHMHSDHIGGLTTQDGTRVFPNADVFVAKAESDYWLSQANAAKAPKEAQQFFQAAKAISAPYTKAGKWHTFSGTEAVMDGVELVSLHGHTPGHTGYEFSSQGQTILFWGDTVHAQTVQLSDPDTTVVFDVDHPTAADARNQLLRSLAREGTLIAGPHMIFPGLGRLRKLGTGYVWVPVAYTDQWVER
jgi:glyoxylase-like metal-dependent hydrolase (beta-lactamase superfamily II)